MSNLFTLRTKPTVDFDAKNPAHVAAIMEVVMNGKLPKEYRFAVQPPFQSVTEMAKHIMAVEYARTVTGKEIHDTYFYSEAERLRRDIPLVVDDAIAGSVIVLPRNGRSSQASHAH